MADVCPCHGEPWAPNGSNRECRVKKRERQRRYALTDTGRARRRRADNSYRATHFKLEIGEHTSANRLYLGTFPCTSEQRERIKAFRKEQHGVTATP